MDNNVRFYYFMRKVRKVVDALIFAKIAKRKCEEYFTMIGIQKMRNGRGLLVVGICGNLMRTVGFCRNCEYVSLV